MSHQTGIQADDELSSFLGKSKHDQRLIKVSIQEEKLVLSAFQPPQGTWEEDYDSMVLSSLEPKQPCYIFYRLDSVNELGYEWIFLCYSPDFAAVRQKMLYASTKATIKLTFGGGQIKEEVFGTTQDDLSFSGYGTHIVSQSAPAPLTFAEEELKLIKETETNHHISVDTKHQTVQGLNFPLSGDAVQRLDEIKQGSINYVQLSIDMKNERIELDNAEPTNVGELNGRFPQDHARYHLFLYKHSHEGDYLESVVFIYTMPGYRCPIKERMLYSSCKNELLEALDSQLGIKVDRKLEVTVGEDNVNDEYLYNELHPPKNVVKTAFAKPKGPARRGPKRMTKTTDPDASTSQ